jgi:hypothetical protein
VKNEEPDKAPVLGINSMTAYEIAQAEQAAHVGMGVFADSAQPQTALKAALAWQLARRTDKTLGYQQYAQHTTLTEINQALFPGDDEDDEDDTEGKEASPA